MKKVIVDKFGVGWKLPVKELCSVCKQPDSCGECNHIQLSKDEVKVLGGIKLASKK
jgi:hypothetical protein